MSCIGPLMTRTQQMRNLLLKLIDEWERYPDSDSNPESIKIIDLLKEMLKKLL